MITTRMIVSEVAHHYALPAERLLSRERSGTVHVPRRMSWVLARDLTKQSIAEIGRRIGAVDHSTVLHGLKRIEAQMIEDKELADDHRRLVAALRAREADEAPVGTGEDPSALAIATMLLAGSLATTEPTVRELRTLCEETLRSAERISELETADMVQALDTIARLKSKLQSKTAEVEANAGIVNAARRVAMTAKALAVDVHTIRERGSRIQHEDALSVLQNLFERT